jgi:hypothetical protein
MNVQKPATRKWFVKRGTKELGPLTVKEVRALIAENKIGPGDSLRRAGRHRWIAAEQLEGLLPAGSAHDEEDTEDPFVHAGKWIVKSMVGAVVSTGTSIKRVIVRAAVRPGRRNGHAAIEDQIPFPPRSDSLAPPGKQSNTLAFFVIAASLLALFIIVLAIGGDGGASGSGKSVVVHGYTRKDGTHVNSYSRSSPGSGSHRRR